MDPFFPPVALPPRPPSLIGWLQWTLETLMPARTQRTRPVLRTYSADRPVRIETGDWKAAAAWRDAWTDLLDRSLEPNVFLEPSFALSAAQHFPSARQPRFVFVVRGGPNGAPDRLIGLWAFERLGPRGIVRAWCPKQSALGTPLLDRVHAAEALDALLAWLARAHPGVAGLMIPALPANGPTAALLHTRLRAAGRASRSFDLHERAMLSAQVDVDAMLQTTVGRKHHRDMARLARRLAERGTLRYVSAQTPEAIRTAAERFLALEAAGWKGERGTALLCDPGLATFARSMTRLLGREARCRIDTLELDGEPIAMGIVLSSGREAVLWKIAYDEAYATYSPGVQFTLAFSRRQTGDPSIDRTDSCAIPQHPMIDRLWAERRAIADCLVATRPGDAAFEAAADREALRRRLRAFAKHVYQATRGALAG